MGIMMKIEEAAKATGLTATALRRGIKQGKYPYIKVGNGRGRIFVNIDMLNKAINQEALNNQERQAKLYEQYKNENYPEFNFKGSVLG